MRILSQRYAAASHGIGKPLLKFTFCKCNHLAVARYDFAGLVSNLLETNTTLT